MIARPTSLESEAVLITLRNIVGRAFELARLARDTALMEECVRLTVEIDRRTDKVLKSSIMSLVPRD